MTSTVQPRAEADEDAAAISAALRRLGRTVAVAESLTSGALASRLGAAEAAGEWFSGGVVAYRTEVKVKVLGVDPGPVVCAPCARQLARGVAALTGSDFGVGLTGVGGPDPVEGHPAGTVFLAVSGPGVDRVEEHQLQGEPAEVLARTTEVALAVLREVVQREGVEGGS
jgi:nicotinamide-nucleotide amidase